MHQPTDSSPGKTHTDIRNVEQSTRHTVKHTESRLQAVLAEKQHSARKSHSSLIDDSLYVDRSQGGSSERSQSKNEQITTKRESHAVKGHSRMEIKENEYRKQPRDQKMRSLQRQVPEIINEKAVEDDQKSQGQELALTNQMIQSADMSLLLNNQSPHKSN